MKLIDKNDRFSKILKQVNPSPPQNRDVDDEEYPHSFIWLDFLTTGDNLKKDQICDVAVIVTDAKVLKKYYGPSFYVKTSQKLIDGMDDHYKKIHSDSNLLAMAPDSRLTH